MMGPPSTTPTHIDNPTLTKVAYHNILRRIRGRLRAHIPREMNAQGMTSILFCKEAVIRMGVKTLWQYKVKWWPSVMLRGLCKSCVAAIALACAATGCRAASFDIICSNLPALNSQFVSLLAEHLDFEPNVAINPRPHDAVSRDNVRTVRLVISGQSRDAVLACATERKLDQDQLDKRIRELQNRLGKEGQPVFPGGPRGEVFSVGEAIILNGQNFFISVSGDDSLMQATAAVAQSHNVSSQACWFDDACLAEVETYWSLNAN